MEQEILALFEKVLSRKVGFHDELIESDILDSILAVDMVLEVQDVYGCMIPPTDVATVLKTPADLARAIQDMTAERICRAMSTVKLDTVYFLKGKEGEA